MSVKTYIAERYRGLLPRPLREPLWHWTRAVWARCVLRHSQEARLRWAQYCVARGRYCKRVALRQGFSLEVDLRDQGVGRTIYADRQWDQCETSFLRACLKPGMSVVDVGANLGYFTVLCAQLVGPSGRVIAIEPDPYNFALLERNVALNRLKNVTAMNVALGAQGGEAMLHRSATNFGDHRVSAAAEQRSAVRVPILTFEEALERDVADMIDLVKIDVQGYEAQVLQGMRPRLRAGQIDRLMMEYWPLGIAGAGDDPAAMLAALNDADFDSHVFDDRGELQRVPVEAIDGELPPFDAAAPDGCFINLVLCRRGIS